ncbi:MAG: cation diffusion facilitator family transporter [Acholeplasma sp.]|nr:cation diffusion facilitator family transporter [Acholeplasma sp.]
MKKIIERVILISLGLNVMLAALKLSFGYLGHSSSLVSDGYNSLSDVLVSITLFVFIKVAHKGPDANHPYGHEKYEALVYFMLGLLLFFTGGWIGVEAVFSFFFHRLDTSSIVKPELYTIYVAITAIFIKVVLYRINSKTAKKYKSPSLKADAMNHLFDVIATTFSLISIVLSQFDLWYVEYFASVLIGIIIIKTSLSILKDAVSFLVDEAPSQLTVSAIEQTVLSVNGVLSIDDLKVRMHVKNLYVDVEISVDKKLDLESAHEISEGVHDLVESKHDVIHCMVHVNPQ